ncbi:Fic family protein [Dyadobacter sp. LJ53]|uniref:Fic family protein n=1 Tax=Dyadobacter chenwenxiniae TaxID=2906456 RepID=UPI001F1875E8|nr:Fic family protein [Dyadobacter chenwenxiniae]MCF0049531.1 Fic family protein [Dyadobacter chenwenxiniae]
MHIHQKKSWPAFTWDHQMISFLLASVRYKQGKLVGRMESLSFSLQDEAVLQTLTLDAVKSNEIEGQILNADQVRSSIARRLGMDIGMLTPADRHVEGVVEMLLDATQHYQEALSEERLFGWHAALFPTGRNGMFKITIGNWRDSSGSPMQVVSGAMGREKVHFEAPDSDRLPEEMSRFISWFNAKSDLDLVIKAAIAHLWFVTIHPFDDGNGRIARPIADMLLARSDESAQRFYSMSAQIQQKRKHYYDILEKTQKGNLDITEWLEWFLYCLDGALEATETTLNAVLNKAKYWKLFAEKNINDRQKIMLSKLLDGFEGKLNTSKWAKIAKTSSDTALRDIQNLVEQGVLEKENSGGRSTSYRLVGL